MAIHTEYSKDTEAEVITEAFAQQVRGRVFLITGVNSKGLGGATARALARQSPKLLILTGRAPGKVEEVSREIKAIDSNVETRFLKIDLASPSAVRKAADEVLAYKENVDVVINNAGVMALPKRQLTTEGLEMQFASNHVGHFLFTNLIMPKIVAAATGAPAGATRIINVSSWGHNMGPVRFSDLAFHKRTADLPEAERKNLQLLQAMELPDPEGNDPAEEGYDSFAAYGQSKTANVLFSLSLTQKLRSKGIKSFSLHPGSIETELARHVDEEALKDLRARVAVARKSLSAGASTQLVAALDPALTAEGKNIYLSDCQLEDAAPWAVDPEAAEKLWAASEKIVGQQFEH